MAGPCSRLSGFRRLIARLRGRDLEAVEDNPGPRTGPPCLRVVSTRRPEGDGPRGTDRRDHVRQAGRANQQVGQELVEGLEQKRIARDALNRTLDEWLIRATSRAVGGD